MTGGNAEESTATTAATVTDTICGTTMSTTAATTVTSVRSSANHVEITEMKLAMMMLFVWGVSLLFSLIQNLYSRKFDHPATSVDPRRL